MKISFMPKVVWFVLLAAVLTVSSPAFGEDHVQMQQAMDLVDKAWAPGDMPPPNSERIELLHKALNLLAQDPYTGYLGHKRKAIRYIHAAIEQINNGDPDNKVFNYLQDAEHQIRDAIADAD